MPRQHPKIETSKASDSFSSFPVSFSPKARNGVYKYTGMWQSLVLVAKEEGRRGLYAGMGTHVVRVVSAKTGSCVILCFGLHTRKSPRSQARDTTHT